jgi:hypothetical protein
MRKIIQILYDHRSTRPGKTLAFLVLCDDGTVWRQVEVMNSDERPINHGFMIVDPTYHTEWEQAIEFNAVPESDHAWTPESENERGR